MDELDQVLRQAFKSEALEHLPVLTEGLRNLPDCPDLEGAIAALSAAFRSAHTLKGSARAIDFPEAEALAAALEEKLRAGALPSMGAFSSEDLAGLQGAADLLASCCNAYADGQRLPPSARIRAALKAIDQAQPSARETTAPIEPPEAEPALELEAMLRASFSTEAAGEFASLEQARVLFTEATSLDERAQAAARAFRAAHTLKGSARAIEEPDLEALSSALEESWRPASTPERASFSNEHLEILAEATGLLGRAVIAYRDSARGPRAKEVRAVLTSLEKIQAGSGVAPEAAPVPVAAADQSLEQLLLETFGQEVRAHLPILRDRLQDMGRAGADEGERRRAVGHFYLAASALKGASRAIDTPDIEALCGALEEVSRAAEHSPDCRPPEATLAALQQALSMLETCAEAFLAGRRGPTPEQIRQTISRVEGLPVSPSTPVELDQDLVALFRAEASDYLDSLNQALAQLEQGDEQQLERIFRDVHSLKGAARSVNLGQLEALCHPLENLLAALKRGQLSSSSQVLATIQRALQTLESMLSADASQRPSPHGLQQLEDELNGWIHGVAPSNSATGAVITPVAPGATAESVRVPSLKLDAMLLQAEEMLSLKMSATQAVVDLRLLRNQMADWQRQWKRFSADYLALRRELENHAQGSDSPAPLAEFLDWNLAFMRALEGRVEQLSRSSAQNQRAVTQGVDQLLEDSKSLLLFPFASILRRYPQLVRDLARDLDKQVNLEITGDETEVDRRILESIKDPLLHLVRNSLDHGVETGAVRKASGKPARARLQIRVRQQFGEKVEIVVSDDGAGIDPQRLREAAIRKGTHTPEAAAALSDSEAIALIFQSDFSTREEVSSISGRGLGMAIVKDEIKRLGGSMTVESEIGAGTTFTILLPLTLANYRAVLVGYGPHQILIPALNVHRIVRVKAGTSASLEVDGRPVRMARLDQLLGVAASAPTEEESLLVVVLESNREFLAAIVDVLHGEHEVLARPLTAPLDRIPYLAGASVLGDGKVAPILRVSQLLEGAQEHTLSVVSRPTARPEGVRRKRVLLADDSLTSRTLLKNVLEGAGLEVVAAADGRLAWDELCETGSEFDLIVTDVEMPHMTGLEFARNVRADERFAKLPIVMVTTLDTPEDRKRGSEAGASAYIPKGSLRSNALLETVGQFL